MSIFQPVINNNSDWVRPADWLPIDHLATNGEQKIVGLYAIFPTTETYYHNKVAFVIRGNYTVNWGDGTIENYNDNTVAQHEYDYDTIPNSTLTSRGYKQAIITIIPQVASNLTSLFLCRVHSSISAGNDDVSNWLDVKVSGTAITAFKMYGSTYFAKALLLEKLVVYQATNTMTDISQIVIDCTNLEYCNLNGLNTSNVTTMAYAFANTSISTLLFNTWDTGNCTSMAAMFYNSTYKLLDLSNFSTNVGKVVGVSNMFFASVVDKIIFGALRIGGSFQQFGYIFACREVDFSNIISAEVGTCANCFDASSAFLSNLKTLDLSKFNATYITSISSAFNNNRMLKEVVFSLGYFTNCTTTGTPFSGCAMSKIRLPKLSLTTSVASNNLAASDINLLFGDLIDLGNPTKYAISTYTINAAGSNYAVGDLITVTGGNNDAVLQVVTLSGSGVASLRFYSSLGTGYSVASGLATTTNGSGTGFKINITALKTAQTITVTGNPGAATCNTSIATNKGWTVVTA